MFKHRVAPSQNMQMVSNGSHFLERSCSFCLSTQVFPDAYLGFWSTIPSNARYTHDHPLISTDHKSNRLPRYKSTIRNHPPRYIKKKNQRTNCKSTCFFLKSPFLRVKLPFLPRSQRQWLGPRILLKHNSPAQAAELEGRSELNAEELRLQQVGSFVMALL